MKVLQMDADELQAYQDCNTKEAIKHLVYEDPDCISSLRSTLVDLLSAFPTTLQDDEKLLTKGNLPANGYLATLYRREQKLIIAEAILTLAQLEDTLNK
jgi:hypothetical protein